MIRWGGVTGDKAREETGPGLQTQGDGKSCQWDSTL